MNQIELIVKLTLARLEIIKLQNIDGGYQWDSINEKGQMQLKNALTEIDSLLERLSTNEEISAEERCKNEGHVMFSAYSHANHQSYWGLNKCSRCEFSDHWQYDL